MGLVPWAFKASIRVLSVPGSPRAIKKRYAAATTSRSPFLEAASKGSTARASPISPSAPAASSRTSEASSCRATIKGSTAPASPISPSAPAASSRTSQSSSSRAAIKASTARASPSNPSPDAAVSRRRGSSSCRAAIKFSTWSGLLGDWVGSSVASGRVGVGDSVSASSPSCAQAAVRTRISRAMQTVANVPGETHPRMIDIVFMPPFDSPGVHYGWISGTVKFGQGDSHWRHRGTGGRVR